MASADKELEDSLMEAGRRLFSPPSDTEELLILLDRTENYLSKVDQLPSPSIFAALCPVREALVAKDLLGHSNLEVKVAVASCVSEIIRITAPDTPYDEDQMKVIFQIIVESFEKLDDISGRSFPKRVSILETVAKVRLCLVMLDLECDALIFDMFWFFLNTIRPNHPENVFSSMELIMSLVLEESDDISPELISCLLNCVKKDNKEVLPVAHRLGEKIISNSAVKLKPYLVQAQSLPGSYSKIVASICQENSDGLEQNEINSSGENLILGIAEDVDQQQKLGESIVGSKIKVWWPNDERFYYGRVYSFDPSNEKHTIVYVDDEVEVLLLKEEHFELLEDGVEIEEDQLEDVPSAFDSPKVVLSNKKVKANPGGSSKKGKRKEPSKSDEHASGAASKPKDRSQKKSKDTPASQVNDETPEITAPDSADEHGGGAVKSLVGKTKCRRPKKSKETPTSTSLRTTGLDSSDKHGSGVLKSFMGKPKGRPSKILKETPSSKFEYETPKTVRSKGKGSGRKSNEETSVLVIEDEDEDTPVLVIEDEDEMEYTAAATHSTDVRKSKDFPPKAVRKSNDDTPRTYSKVKCDNPKMCSKSMDVDPPKSSGKFKDASVKSSSKSVDVDPPRSSGKYTDGSVKSTIVVAPKSSSKYNDGSVKSRSKSTVETLKAIVDAPKSSSGKYKDGLVKSSSKFTGETPKSIVDAPKSAGKYKESSMKSHNKSMDLDSPKSSGKHTDASGKASIKPMDVDIPKSSGKSKDGSMKTSDGTAKGGPKTKPKGDVIPRTVGDKSTFDGSSEKGKGKVRAGESSEAKLHETQTLAEIQVSLGSAENSRKRKARK